MKYAKDHIEHNEVSLDDVMSACGAIPHGDDLPQVAGLNDILTDVYSEALNIPHEYAAGALFHQHDEGFDYEGMIH
jgi:hypothetical protein